VLVPRYETELTGDIKGHIFGEDLNIGTSAGLLLDETKARSMPADSNVATVREWMCRPPKRSDVDRAGR
jgi:hypothetical protein